MNRVYSHALCTTLPILWRTVRKVVLNIGVLFDARNCHELFMMEFYGWLIRLLGYRLSKSGIKAPISEVAQNSIEPIEPIETNRQGVLRVFSRAQKFMHLKE